MYDIGSKVLDSVYCFHSKRISRAVACYNGGGIIALIRYHGIRVGAVIRVGVFRRAYCHIHSVGAVQHIGVIEDSVRYAVDHRREGIIQKTYVHTCHLRIFDNLIISQRGTIFKYRTCILTSDVV